MQGRRGTNTQTHSAGPYRGESDRFQIDVCREGGSGERQEKKEWWEGDRRERNNGEKRGGMERWEDDMRERDEVPNGREGVGGGGRWRGGGKLRGEGWGAKQERKEQDQKAARWDEREERWRWEEEATCMREEGQGKRGS